MVCGWWEVEGVGRWWVEKWVDGEWEGVVGGAGWIIGGRNG